MRPITQTLVLLSIVVSSSLLSAKSNAAQLPWHNSISPIQSLDVSAAEDDLFYLNDKLADKRLLFLGEQSHGDKKTYQLKSKIVQYLHQKQNFNVLAIESGLYDVAKIWQQVLLGQSIHKEMKGSLFYMYAQNKELHPLFDYIAAHANTEKPLLLVGFDGQHSGIKSQQESVQALLDFVHNDENEILTTKQKIQLSYLLDKLFKFDQNPPSSDDIASLQYSLALIKHQLSSHSVNNNKPILKRADFWLTYLNSIESQIKTWWVYGRDSLKGGNARDKQMGKNLTWIANKLYPNKKIIVWGHNMHVAKNLSKIDKAYSSFEAMHKKLQKQSHVILFTSGRGIFRDWNLTQEQIIPIAKENSLEAQLNELKIEYAFIDLSSHANFKQKQFTRAAMHQQIEWQPSRHADSFIYIKEEHAANY